VLVQLSSRLYLDLHALEPLIIVPYRVHRRFLKVVPLKQLRSWFDSVIDSVPLLTSLILLAKTLALPSFMPLPSMQVMDY